MKTFEDFVAIIGVTSIILILFTPLIWIWISFEMFTNVFLTFCVIFFACFVITKLINESK